MCEDLIASGAWNTSNAKKMYVLSWYESRGAEEIQNNSVLYITLLLKTLRCACLKLFAELFPETESWRTTSEPKPK